MMTRITTFREGIRVSDATHTTFSRIISDRHFLTRPLLSATVLGVLSSVLIAVIVLCVGTIFQLLTVSTKSAAPPVDDLPARILDRLSATIPALQRPDLALTFLCSVIVVAVVCRALLKSLADRKISQRVATGVNKLREHIQRQALRSNPGDLTGMKQKTAAGLFQKTARQLEENASQWGLLRLTTVCDLATLILLLVSVQWLVGLECVIPILVCWFIARVETERHTASTNLLSEQVDRGLQRLTEDLDKARIVTGYGMENLEHEHFSRSLQEYQQRCNNLWQRKLTANWTSLLITIATMVVPAVIVARHIILGELIGLATGAMLLTTLGLIIWSLSRWHAVPKLEVSATVAADDINQYLLRVPPVSQMVGAGFLEPMARILQFDQVSVETETNPDLLSNLDLKIAAGKRIALLSLNPNEAEALVNLIPRFADPSSGQVLIDGKDIRRVTLESLRAEAVVVGGDEPVFNATVLENITAGQPDISRQDAIEASKTVHAESFIRKLPKGYETHLGDTLTRLDVGQRFLLSLARAIARKPALLVVQEPDAALDDETKTMLDDTYQRICSGRTVIFLPSRLSTVKKCDRVVMLHHGRVAADGKHEELVRLSELYRHWEYVRFNVFRGDINGQK
jgi:ATP-binding cassette, subfamily B, bacterial